MDLRSARSHLPTATTATPRAGSPARRHFLRSSTALGLGSQIPLPGAAQAAGTSLEAYASATSVAAGGTLTFHARDPQALGAGTSVVPVSFTRVGAPDVAMGTSTMSVGNPAVPADAPAAGCGWPVSLSLTVPASWPSGLYYAYIGSGATACTVPFVVRRAGAASAVRTLVLIPVSTVQAYNAYGGKSLYDFNSSGGVRAPKVSFNRPFTEAFNSFFDVWSQYLVRWLTKNQIAADFCTDIDLHANASLLAPYQLLVQAGHHEYWTQAMRTRLDDFVARGGNLAVLGGNTCWFQSRLEAGSAGSTAGAANRTLVCYKDAATDPVSTPALKTINWHSLTPPKPENTTLGLSFLKGCSWASGSIPRPVTPYKVYRNEHWVFAGTNLARNAEMGGAYVGYECDAADFTLGGTDLRPHPTALDGSPATLRILAQADASNWNALSLAAGGGGEYSGYCAMSIFSRGGRQGTVFNAGSTDWAFGLRPELDGQAPTPISRITLNVIRKLAGAWTESADVRQFHANTGTAPGNCYLTLGTSAPAGSGMALDGLVFRAFPAAVANSFPVYRYRSTKPGSTGTRYRYSLRSTLDLFGLFWVREAVAFHAYPSARSGATAPVYEHYRLNTRTLELACVYSTDATPPAGWSRGDVVFHAPLA